MKQKEMKPSEFTTFDEMVSVLALNNPHALVLDWWRRLDRAIDYYFAARGLPRPNSVDAEKVIAGDPELGPVVAAEIRQLRQARNDVAHKDTQPITQHEAARYATRCLHLIWRVGTDPTDTAAPMQDA